MSGPERIDLAEFVGSWLSSERQPRAVGGLVMAGERGELSVRVLGADGQAGADWGEQRIEAPFSDGPASTAGAGFLLDRDLGFARAHLQVQLKLGVAVVGTFLTLGSGAAGRRGFVREFLGRLPAGDPAAAILARAAGREPGDAAAAALEAALAPGRGPRLLAGRWLATAARPAGPAAVEVEVGEGDRVRLIVPGLAGAGRPAEVAAAAYGCLEEDGVPSCCLLARHEGPAGRVELQVRQNRGILAVTRFCSGAGDGCDYVTRELFYREPGSDAGGPA